MSTIYPRDLIGYGRTPPDPQWPGHARIAVQFVINYKEVRILSCTATRPRKRFCPKQLECSRCRACAT
jgi:hypothetical protein